MEVWNTDKSSELYGINEWGAGYFSIEAGGNTHVHPLRNSHSLDLFDLISTLKRRGIDLPVIVRFDQIIESQIQELNQAFTAAIGSYSYQNRYRLAYPIKVNQQFHVVEAVQEAGREYEAALEVGSKPELIAVLAMLDKPAEMLLCNGYKDAEYLELALLGRKLGKRTIIIIEQLYELHEVLRIAERLGVEPELGFRMKPLSRGCGKWEASGGDNAKFGLNSRELLSGIACLKEQNALHYLSLLHFHMGSQVSSIVAIKRVMREAARMYVEVKKLAPALSILDVGGGLGVDYDGSQTNSECSINYCVDEYARDVVWAIKSACDEEGIEHPEIMSESGRFCVAHHSVLVMEVTDVSPGEPMEDLLPTSEPSHKRAQELWYILDTMHVKNLSESFHDALSIHEETFSAFLQGTVSLEERAAVDTLFRATCSKARQLARKTRHVPEELDQSERYLRDTYFCSFSVFQSLPDSWAIGQLFPVMPIHRLNEKPTRKGLVADLTCDSDGKIDRFIDIKDPRESLPLHEYHNDEPYYVASFLVGAYQETLGDLHNLFGDVNVVHVRLDENGKPVLDHVLEGETMRDVLAHVEYNGQELVERFRASIEIALRDNRLTPEQAADLTARYKRSLDGYTYFVK